MGPKMIIIIIYEDIKNWIFESIMVLKAHILNESF